jgi:hypothetical protein
MYKIEALHNKENEKQAQQLARFEQTLIKGIRVCHW